MDLKANTAVDVLIGPFVDKTDGNTTEDALTLTAAEIKLSKNGQALTLKSDATAASFDDDGYYNCELDATDTNTEGNLVLIVHQSANALPVRHEYNVLAEAAWDSLYAAKDTGLMDVNVSTITANAITAASINADAITSAKIADDALVAANFATGALTADAFAADALVAATFATDSIAADALAADAVTEIQSGLATTTELNKVPKSDGTATWNATALASIEAECDDAITANTLIGTLPTTTEFELRTLPSADYVVVGDTIAGVTLCGTTTTNTDLVSAASVADAVWEEAIADHSGTAGSTAESLDSAATAGDPWSTALPGAYGAGTAGEILGDWKNGERLDLLLDDIPSTSEFEARTIASADYVVTTDTIAGVTLVATTTDVTNEVTADVTKISGSATAADNLEASALTIIKDSVNDAGATTTTFIGGGTASLGSSDDQYNGRIIIFLTATATGALQAQATAIEDYTGATKTFTVTALNTAPANGETFIIV